VSIWPTRWALPLAAIAASLAVGSITPAGARATPAGRRPAESVVERTGAPSRAPGGPPLVEASGAMPGPDAAEGTPGLPPGEVDPLVRNGLRSPLCSNALGPGEVSATGRRDCETSGFLAAPAPTGDYGIDVHIDTGVLGLSSGGLLSVVQDLIVTPIWMALVWAVHALVVMLEWAFSIDLLDTAAAGGLGKGLRQAEATLTEPWLALVLAAASVLALYDGLIRRRVAETLGRTLLMAVMMVGGMWVIADPAATVGALGAWANQASLGALAVAARGTPATPGRALTESLDAIFAAAIEGPWCYLEFGDVGWCRDPAHRDPELREAGLKIAAAEMALVGCASGAVALLPCAARGTARAKALEQSARLLIEAPSNGAVFLALPANGAERNSINQQGSLLRTLCQSPEATNCRGPTAAQAEFRTDSGTWPRVGGLLLIGVGVLGMLLLLGFLGLRLLTAALFSLLFLLLAPGMVLSPALGEAGRTIFRRWASQLLTAVVSKLLFAFLLGVVLAVAGLLSQMTVLGWWTQWLLMSFFWWGAFARRNQALGLAHGAFGGESRPSGSLVRRVAEVVEAPRRALRTARETRERLKRRAPPRNGDARPTATSRPAPLDTGWRAPTRSSSAWAELRTPSAARDDDGATQATTHEVGTSEGAAEERAERTQLPRTERPESSEPEFPDERSVSVGATRAASQGTIESGGEVRDGGDVQRGPAPSPGPSASNAVGGGSDAQLWHPAPRPHPVGNAAEQHPRRREDQSAQRAGRGELERDMNERRRLGNGADAATGGHAPASERPATLPSDRRIPQLTDVFPPGRGDQDSEDPGESSVMRDAREVAARRKRQLGIDRD